jgi:hypothetical protein
MNSTEKLEMQEEADGGAVVNLPDDQDNPQDFAEGGEIDNHPDDTAGVDINDPDREQIRIARREERRLKKQLNRERNNQSNHLISALKKQNQALELRLANVESRTSGAELARVDKVIDDTQVQIEYSKMKMREAVSQQDGDAVVKAQELMYESQRKLEALNNIKANATKQMSAQKQNINVPDPMVQEMAAEWMSRHKWYDPQGKDLDSELAQRIDKKLTEEGFDPSSQDYWDELDDRLRKYVPHHFNNSRAQRDDRSQRTPPRYIVTGSGRENAPNTRSNQYVISPQRVAAMKEAGAWDDPVRKAAMIKRYMEHDRLNKGNQ